MTQERLGKINSILTIIVVLLGLYIAVSPLLPAFAEWWQRENTIPTTLTQSVEGNKPLPKNTSIDGNRLSIPVMNLDEPILEGQSEKTVNKGVWKLPNSADPGAGSNTVLVGHRYSYNPGIAHPFYSLDIVNVGDSIGVYWNNTLFTYVVTQILIVPPEAVEIEAPTEEEQLTIYTCTPLWTSNSRLVVIAKPIEANQ
jgi:sortase A